MGLEVRNEGTLRAWMRPVAGAFQTQSRWRTKNGPTRRVEMAESLPRACLERREPSGPSGHRSQSPLLRSGSGQQPPLTSGRSGKGIVDPKGWTTWSWVIEVPLRQSHERRIFWLNDFHCTNNPVRFLVRGVPRISSEHREGAPGKRTHACQDNSEAGTGADEAPFRLLTPRQVPDHCRGG